MKINNEEIFSCPENAFAISASASGYTLNFSVDKITWTAYGEPTPANENLLITGAPRALYYKLVGNTDEVLVQW